MRKIFLSFLFIITIFTAACSSSDPEEASGSTKSDSAAGDSAKSTLNIGLDADPPQLDPHLSSAAVDRQTYQSLFNKLIDINEDLEFIPELAVSWDVSDDGLVYTFGLQEDVVFHDGEPFNAEAVKYNFDRMLNPDMNSPRLSEISMISEVKVIGDYEIEITLSEPSAPFLAALTDRAGMMVSPLAAEELGDDFANKPVGTGPYKFVERVAQSHISLERFDDYWRGAPAIENIKILPYADANVRVTNLVSGELDILNKIAYKDIKTLDENPDITLMEKEGLGFNGIHLNTAVEPLNNKAVRQAINLAVDREAITNVVFHGGAVPSVSPFPSTSWAAPDFEFPNADVEQAKKILQDAGISDVNFTMKISPNPEDEQTAQMIQSMLGEIGITMDIEMVEFGTLLDQMGTGDFQAAHNGWSGRIDPDGNTYRFFYTDSANNYTNYSNPVMDELLNEGRAVGEQADRIAIYKEVAEILWEDAPYIFLYHELDYKAMKSNVKGFSHNPDTMIRTEFLSFE